MGKDGMKNRYFSEKFPIEKPADSHIRFLANVANSVFLQKNAFTKPQKEDKIGKRV